MKDWPVEAEELQMESQQVHTDSNPYSSTHLRKQLHTVNTILTVKQSSKSLFSDKNI